MTTSNFNLRGITPRVMLCLKQKAKEQHTSVNLLILSLVEQGLGGSSIAKKMTYHDLDSLAGTWTTSDSKAFEKNIKAFEKIDEDFWS